MNLGPLKQYNEHSKTHTRKTSFTSTIRSGFPPKNSTFVSEVRIIKCRKLNKLRSMNFQIIVVLLLNNRNDLEFSKFTQNYGSCTNTQ